MAAFTPRVKKIFVNLFGNIHSDIEMVEGLGNNNGKADGSKCLYGSPDQLVRSFLR